MHPARLASALALALLTAGAADAQYPIAPGAFKCQAAAAKVGQKFIGAKAKCVLKCEGGARKGLNPFTDCDPPYGGATLTCIGDPVKGAQAKALAGIVKACTKTPLDCPACYSGGDCSVTGHASAVVVNLELQLDAFVPAVACVETTDKGEAKCMDGTAKTLTKFVGAVSKCYGKCFALAQKLVLPTGSCYPPATDPSTASCIATAAGKALVAIDKACFVGSATAPACYDDLIHPPAILPSPSTAAGWVAFGQLAVDSTVPSTYCGP